MNLTESHSHLGDFNPFFIYGSSQLVNVKTWPLYDAYHFYLRWKVACDDEPGFEAMIDLRDRLRSTFEDDDMNAIRSLRRNAGRDPNDSDLEYDPDNDSDIDAPFDGDSNLERIRREVRYQRMLDAQDESEDGENEEEEGEEEEEDEGLEGYISGQDEDKDGEESENEEMNEENNVVAAAEA